MTAANSPMSHDAVNSLEEEGRKTIEKPVIHLLSPKHVICLVSHTLPFDTTYIPGLLPGVGVVLMNSSLRFFCFTPFSVAPKILYKAV